MSQQQKEETTTYVFDDRQLPFSVASEKAVIGSMIMATDFGESILSEVRSEDFYDTPCRLIFNAIVSLLEQSRPIDINILIDRLNSRGAYERCGGAVFVAEIVKSVPNAFNILHYARIVSKYALRRRVIESCTKAMNYAWDDNKSGGVEETEIAATVEDAISEALLLRTVKAHKAIDLFPRVGQTIKDRLLGQGNMSTAIPTGIDAIDELLGGLFPDEVTVLAARPSMGKTALSCQIAANLSFAKIPVVYVSIEMKAEELAMRQICSWAGLNLHHIKTGKASASDSWVVESIANDLSSCDLYVADNSDITPREIVSLAKQIKRETSGPIVVMVDYIGLVSFEGNKKRNEQIGYFMRQMKRLARQCSSPVVLMSQLNRATENDKDKRPKLSNLRESGDIEQDADVVAFLHRQEYYEPKNPDFKGLAEVIIAKNRSGPVGTAEMLWNKQTLTFADTSSENGESEEQQLWENKQEELEF